MTHLPTTRAAAAATRLLPLGLAAFLLLGRPPAATAADPAPTGDGYVRVPEDLVTGLDEDAEHHFIRARDHVVGANRRQAAREIRTGAGLFRLEGSLAPAADRELLATALDALEDLAREVEAGDRHEPVEFGAVARAHAVMARLHVNRARNQGTTGEPVRIGGDLAGALHHLSSADSWIARKRSEEEWLPLADLAGLADRMRARLAWRPEEMESGLLLLERELAGLDLALAE